MLSFYYVNNVIYDNNFEFIIIFHIFVNDNILLTKKIKT